VQQAGLRGGDINMGHDPDNKIAIDFLDPLFAVIFHISFVQVYEQQWFWSPRLIFAQPNLFHVATLSLTYFTVISSWIGYHVSVKTRGIDVENPYGKWRFFFDIMLLFSYFVLFVSFENFKRELWILAFIYFVFIFWDQMKRLEWRDEDEKKDIASRRDLVARRGVTVFWFVFFLGLAVVYQIYSPTGSCGCEDCMVFIAALLGILLYRLHKQKLWFKGALMILGYPKGNV
jgi:hypothetical protein